MSVPRDRSVHVGAAWRLILRDLGLDQRTVLRRAGQPATLFDGEGTYVSIDTFYALHEAVEAEAHDPTLALRTGGIVSVELFDPALFAAICSPNLNTAARRLGQFKRLVGAFTLDLDIDEDRTVVRYRCKHRPDVPRLLGLTEMVFQVAFARRATRHPVVPLKVTVQRLPDAIAPFSTYFGCEPEQADVCSVVFSATDARRPFLTHNSVMWETFEPGLRRRMLEAEEFQSTSERVQAVLFELLPSGRAQLREVARELGLGTRTLQRRLSSDGTTWLEVLNLTRERLARHYLVNSNMSAAEVSFLLGFEDPNSLFRAFQRWTGTTPELWRAHRRQDSTLG